MISFFASALFLEIVTSGDLTRPTTLVGIHRLQSNSDIITAVCFPELPQDNQKMVVGDNRLMIRLAHSPECRSRPKVIPESGLFLAFTNYSDITRPIPSTDFYPCKSTFSETRLRVDVIFSLHTSPGTAFRSFWTARFQWSHECRWRALRSGQATTQNIRNEIKTYMASKEELYLYRWINTFCLTWLLFPIWNIYSWDLLLKATGSSHEDWRPNSWRDAVSSIGTGVDAPVCDCAFHSSSPSSIIWSTLNSPRLSLWCRLPVGKGSIATFVLLASPSRCVCRVLIDVIRSPNILQVYQTFLAAK